MNLSNNQLVDFPLGLGGLKNLNVVNLSNNRITQVRRLYIIFAPTWGIYFLLLVHTWLLIYDMKITGDCTETIALE